MCAMMQKLRTRSATSVRCGDVTSVADEDLRADEEVVDHPQDAEQHHERDIEAAYGRNEPADRIEERLDQHVDVAAPRTAKIRDPRQHRVHQHDDGVKPDDLVDRREKLTPCQAHGAWLSTEGRLKLLPVCR